MIPWRESILFSKVEFRKRSSELSNESRSAVANKHDVILQPDHSLALNSDKDRADGNRRKSIN